MENKYSVYMHRNVINNKVYIGQTMQTPSIRWDSGYGYQSCTKFQRAIEKYGWSNFEHIIIQSDLTLEEANELEYQLIMEYDSINNGYNIRTGGDNSFNHNLCIPAIRYDKDGSNPVFYASRAEGARDTNIKNSTAISNVCNGKSLYAGGYIWRNIDAPLKEGEAEEIAQRKKNQTEHVTLHENAKKLSSPVIQIDTKTGEIIGRYDSISAAQRLTGVSRTTIRRHCNELDLNSPKIDRYRTIFQREGI